MAKISNKRRRKQERATQQQAQDRQEWEQRVLETAESSIPDRGARARLVLAVFFLGFAGLVLVGFLVAPGEIRTGGDTSLLLVLITGLTTGGLSCLAVQGGLLATTIAQREQQDLDEVEHATVPSDTGSGAPDDEMFAVAVARQREMLVRQAALHHSAAPVLWFLGAKLAAYTLLGLGLGWVGAQLRPSPTLQGALQLATAFLMIATAMHLLRVHPIFRYVIIQPPRFITRRIRSQAKSRDVFAPAILGAMTVFMPCGITQAMELAAINSASPLRGAAIMFAFVLGTSPLFLGLGVMATRLGDAMHERFLKVAAVAVLALGVLTMDTGLRLVDSPVSLSKAAAAIAESRKPVPAKMTAPGVQEARIRVEQRGYKPGRVSIKSGKATRVVFVNNGSSACTSILVWQDTAYELPVTGEKVFKLGPRAKGDDISYSCGMGMYGGSIKVV